MTTLPIWKPYRPSNGTEGMMFMDDWCARCARDAATRKGDYEHGCRILARSLTYNLGDAEYPREWIQCTEGEPFGEKRCTAFVPACELSERAKRAWDARREARRASFAGDLFGRVT